MAIGLQPVSSRLTATPALPEVLRQDLRRALKDVLTDHFERYIPMSLDDTFRPITRLTSLVTRRREHLAKLHLKQAVIGVILDGRKELHIAGRAWQLQPGNCFLLPAGIDLDVVNEPDERQGVYRAIVLNLPPALILRAGAAYPTPIGHADPTSIVASPLLPLTPAAIDSLVHAVHEIVLQSSATATTLATQLIEHRVMEVMLHFADRILTAPAALPRIGDRARLHLHGAPDRAWTAAALAGELNMSEATLRRQLRDVGLGFKQLLDEARMDLAKRLLPDTSLSIDSIAMSCGYAARGKFEQRFKKLTGQTPQGFRQAR
ncbi:MAG TPA: AraC family transcriptional regulator [Dongiaceae bacterium]|nr:AraC family transcriptional regulator [Dongiaceae bacterium]